MQLKRQKNIKNFKRVEGEKPNFNNLKFVSLEDYHNLSLKVIGYAYQSMITHSDFYHKPSRFLPIDFAPFKGYPFGVKYVKVYTCFKQFALICNVIYTNIKRFLTNCYNLLYHLLRDNYEYKFLELSCPHSYKLKREVNFKFGWEYTVYIVQIGSYYLKIDFNIPNSIAFSVCKEDIIDQTYFKSENPISDLFTHIEYVLQGCINNHKWRIQDGNFFRFMNKWDLDRFLENLYGNNVDKISKIKKLLAK